MEVRKVEQEEQLEEQVEEVSEAERYMLENYVGPLTEENVDLVSEYLDGFSPRSAGFARFIAPRDDVYTRYYFHGGGGKSISFDVRFHELVMRYKEFEAVFSGYGFSVKCYLSRNVSTYSLLKANEDGAWYHNVRHPHHSGDNSLCINGIYDFRDMWEREMFSAILEQARRNLSSYNPHDSYTRLPHKNHCDTCGELIAKVYYEYGSITCRAQGCSQTMCGMCFRGDDREIKTGRCSYCDRPLVCEEHSITRGSLGGVSFCSDMCVTGYLHRTAHDMLVKYRRDHPDLVFSHMESVYGALEMDTGRSYARAIYRDIYHHNPIRARRRYLISQNMINPPPPPRRRRRHTAPF